MHYLLKMVFIVHLGVSPGFMPRPSLSDVHFLTDCLMMVSVAGVYAPAFVERLVAVRYTV